MLRLVISFKLLMGLICFIIAGSSGLFAQDSTPIKKGSSSLVVKKPASNTQKAAEKTSTTKNNITTKPTDKKSTTSSNNLSLQPQSKPKPVNLIQVLQGHLLQMQVKIDKQQSTGNTLVTHYSIEKDGKSKDVSIALVYMPSKHVLGFYTYSFGNVGKVKTLTGVYTSLLSFNDHLAIGSFFVDKEQDIGLKCVIPVGSSIGFDEFKNVFMAMIAAVKQYRSQIQEQLVAVDNNKKSESSTPNKDKENPNTVIDETRKRRVNESDNPEF